MALLMMTLLGFAGLAIDGSNAFYQQQRMQIAADAASLGGARLLALGTTDSALNAEIQSLGHANAADTVTWSYINSQRGVHVAAQHTFPTYFARLYGFNTFTVSAEAEGQFDPVNAAGGLMPFIAPCGCLPADASGGGTTTAAWRERQPAGGAATDHVYRESGRQREFGLSDRFCQPCGQHLDLSGEGARRPGSRRSGSGHHELSRQGHRFQPGGRNPRRRQRHRFLRHQVERGFRFCQRPLLL